ncbi:MAG: TonB family protein [bacterium]
MNEKKEHKKKKDIKRKYPLFLKISILFSLVLFIVLFQTVPKFEPRPYKMSGPAKETEMEKLPDEMMKQPEEPKEIKKPQLPKKVTEAESEEEVTEDVDFETTFDDPSLTEEQGEIYRVYEDAPQVVQMVDPAYPETAKQLGIEGTVFLELVVEKDGSVSNVKVVRGVHPLLDDAARSAAYQMRFTPAMSRDIAVRAYVTFPVNFTLED